MSISTLPRRRRIPLVVGILVGCAVCLILIYFLSSRHANNDLIRTGLTNKATHGETAVMRSGSPTRLKIPKLNIDTTIDRVGLTSQGDLEVPKSADSTGWYKDGPRPGEAGSSVIDGHFGWINGKAAIFDNLHELQKGDALYTEDENGVTTKFVVGGTRLYNSEENATAVFHTSDGKARLNLITCQGTWNKKQQSYNTRLVVFADKK